MDVHLVMLQFAAATEEQRDELILQRPQDPSLTDTLGRTPLGMTSDGEITRLLVEAGSERNLADDIGETALISAAREGRTEVARALLEFGASTDLSDDDGWTALTVASVQGHLDVVRLLLEAEAELDLAADLEWTALLTAARRGYGSLLYALMASAEFYDNRGCLGWTALIGASRRGHSEVVGLLLAARADKDLADSRGKTALASAARRGDVMMVWQLLRAGADMNLADDDGRTPVHAVLHSHEEMAQFQRSKDNDLISRGFQIILEVLLEGGAEKNMADNFGRTPLHVAARQGNLALLRLILKARADPDLGDDNHRTALHAASDLGLDSNVRLLLEAFADRSLIDRAGSTALALASAKGYREVVQVLSAGRAAKRQNGAVRARDVGDCVKKLTIPALSFGPPAPRCYAGCCLAAARLKDPQPIAVDTALHIRQEQKRSGERRKCKWCLKYKPDRTHHCRVCRMCILKMDHHCPWIYNCVGFRNYKYFFLLLVYTNIDCVLVVSTMLPSVRAGTQPTTPFMTMFLLIFGETLAGFLCVLVTMFLGFHIYLMLQAMTTIEFCEKSTRGGFRASIYDRGFVGNICAVLGDNPLLWMLPMAPPKGRGLTFVTEDTRLTQDMEAGRGLRRRAHEAKEAAHIAPKRRTDRPFSTGGTGSTGQSEEDSQSGSGSEEVPRAVADVGSSRDRPARASATETGSYGATAVGETGAPADVVAASSGGTSPLLSPTGGDKTSS
eukprot:s857_g8.t2